MSSEILINKPEEENPKIYVYHSGRRYEAINGKQLDLA